MTTAIGMLGKVGKIAGRDPILACFRPVVGGRPGWRAAYLTQGLCRIKWMSAAGIVLWVVQAIAVSGSMRRFYEPAAAQIGTSAQTLVDMSVSVGIITAAMSLVTALAGVSIQRATMITIIGASGAIVAEALMFGFAQLVSDRVASLDVVLLIVLAVVPIGLFASIALVAIGMIVVVASASVAGFVVPTERLTFLIHPISFAAFGIVANRWYQGTFRAERLVQLRLQRHTRQVEHQKRLIEAQKNEAMRQRAEIANQHGILLHALASALTAPVAQAYLDHGRFPTELRTVCVIACDAVGFSDTCRKLQPERVVFELEKFFREFDAACLKCHVEPLRAQGDSRIAIAGLWPGSGRRLHQEVISAILAMLYFKSALPGVESQTGQDSRQRVLWPARMGICLGPASCGIIDTSAEATGAPTGRLWFDVWGDTVNLAARLQEAAQPNQLLVRESVLWETCDLFDHGPFHQIQIKTTTLSDVAEILGIRRPFRDDDGLPNAAFWDVFSDLSAKPRRPNSAGTTGDVAAIRVAP